MRSEAEIYSTVLEKAYKLEAENAQLKTDLAQAKAGARENYDFLIQSRDCILHEFCLLQVTYGEQKHELRNLKAELAQATQREARLREALQMLVDKNENSFGGIVDWDECWDDAKQTLKEIES